MSTARQIQSYGGHDNYATASQLKLLIVEDDPHDCEYISYCLKRLHHFETQTTIVHDRQQALAMLEIQSFDFIILDFWLGHETTMSLADTIRTDFPETPVLFMSNSPVEPLMASLDGRSMSFLSKLMLKPESLEQMMTHML